MLTKVHIVKAVVFLVVMYELEKERATHSNILAWRIPWTEKPGGLQTMGLQRGARLSNFPEKAVAPHSSTLAWKIPWTEKPGRL